MSPRQQKSKMSIPNEALQRILAEIEQRAFQSKQQLSQVKQQMAQKQRDIRVSELTANEFKRMGSATAYEGVGKMWDTLYTSANEGSLPKISTSLMIASSRVGRLLSTISKICKRS